eukprot:sb/3478355/
MAMAKFLRFGCVGLITGARWDRVSSNQYTTSRAPYKIKQNGFEQNKFKRHDICGSNTGTVTIGSNRRTTQPFWLIQSLSDRPCQGLTPTLTPALTLTQLEP